MSHSHERGNFGPLIFGAVTDEPYPVGFIGRGIVDCVTGHTFDQPWKVLRSATMEEWLTCRAERGAPTPPPNAIALARRAHFYEIHTD